MTTNEVPPEAAGPAEAAEAQELRPDTVAIRAGRGANGSALAPVLWATSAFVTDDAASAARMAKSTGATEFYSRYGNPTVAAFESAIAELEHAEACRAFASGMGALTAVVLGLLSSGDHIVSQRQLYGGTQLLLSAVCPRFGIDVTFVDAADPEAWDAAIQPGRTMMCLAESPANPRLDPRRSRAVRRHSRADHRGRFHVRHPDCAAAARPWRAARRSLGNKGHRGSQ